MTQDTLEQELRESKDSTRRVEKGSGYEIWIANSAQYCGKLLIVKAGHRGSKHYHKEKDETFYVLQGRVVMEAYDGMDLMHTNGVLRIKPGTVHRFSNIDLDRLAIILEVSTQHFDEDTYRVEGTASGLIPEEEILSLKKKYFKD